MEIIYPMFALVVLTVIIGVATGLSRLISIKNRSVDIRYFKLLSSEYPLPETMAKLGRNFSNLLEVPVLFYIACVTVLALGINNSLILGLAWAFVIFRVIHSIIHVTYNFPFHRLIAFSISSLIALIMWVQLVLIVSQKI